MNEELKATFKPHFDSYGLIVEQPWEGGDTCCEHFGALILCKWMGWKLFLDGSGIDEAYRSAVEKLVSIPSGLWRRHCARHVPAGQHYWASEWNRATRDNGTAAFIATIVFHDEKTFRAMFEGFRKRFWFCGNTFPRNVWAHEIEHRKYGAPWRQPHDPTPTVPDTGLMLKAIAYRSPWVNKSTWFWDIACCLIPAILIRRMIKKGENDGNHLNAFMRIEFCYRRGSTWVSRLAHRLLPKNIGLDLEFGDGSASAKRNPPMHLLTNQYQEYISQDL